MFQLPKVIEEKQEAIIVNNVSKRFRIPHEKKTTVFDHIAGVVKGSSSIYEEFWALKDVSFRLKKGETLGVIGENGSGKSTLLKIIAGVLSSDSGNVEVKGRIAPFLELGVGFQPDLTAEDNVRLYGAIMGMKKEEIEEKFEEIFEFAELERFKDMKLKNFSSGMYARLAFATAVATDPDILLIDEVLAVGDAAFQKKCIDKFHDFKKQKKTIVFVSHSIDQIEMLCGKTIFLEHGKIFSTGETKDVAADYMTRIYNKERSAANLQMQKEHKAQEEQKQNDQKVEPEPPKNRWGNKEVEITEVKFFGGDGEEKYVFKTGESMIVRMKYFAKKKIDKPVFGMAIYKNDGAHINGTNCKLYNTVLDSVEGEGEAEYIVKQLPLLDGTYLFSAVVYDYSCTVPYDHHDRRFTFRVFGGIIKDVGLIYMPSEWRFNDKNNGKSQ